LLPLKNQGYGVIQEEDEDVDNAIPFKITQSSTPVKKQD
jgi:hypothetical protein